MLYPDNNSEPTVRLSKSPYTRPNVTITDSLQHPDAYKEKLKGYTEVKNTAYIDINTHVRYFIYNLDEDRWKFRTGGLLKRNNEKYVVLSNGRLTWCVQKEIMNEETGDIWETKFFKILTKMELSDIALEKQQEEIEQLRAENIALKQQVYSIHHN